MSKEGDPDPSPLFKSLMGEVSQQQWETFKRSNASDMIIAPNLEDELFSDDSNESEMDVASEEGEESEPDAEPVDEAEKKKFGLNFQKYLKGEININDLTSVIEKDGIVEDEVQGPSVEQTNPPESDQQSESAVETETDFDDDRDPDWRPETKFEQELLRSQRNTFSGRKSGTGGSGSGGGGIRKSKLPRHLQGLVGEANLCFARGKHEDAVRMCLEVIRLEPTANEPYQTLGTLYEDMGDAEKAFQYRLIAAYLCPSDGDEWIKVAEMAVEQNDINRAIDCYSKAIRVYPKNLPIQLERSHLCEKVAEYKKAMDGYEKVLKVLEPNQGELALKIAKNMAKIHFANKQFAESIQIMETVFEKFAADIASEDVNLYIELLEIEKKYVEAIVAFKRYCGVQYKFGDKDGDDDLSEEFIRTNCENMTVRLPYQVFPIDLRAKLIVALINLRCLMSVKELQEVIEKEDAEETGDLYLDLAEAYLEMKLFPKAEPLLKRLVSTRSYNYPAVWLRYARCLKELQETERSIVAFYEVVRLVPNHYEARLELSELLLSADRSQEATQVTSQSDGDVELNLELQLIRCRLLYDQEDWPEFVSAARLLLLSDMCYLSRPKEMNCMITSTTHRTRIDSLRDVHREMAFDPNENKANYVGKDPTPDEMMEMFVKLLRVLSDKCCDEKELVRIAFSAFTCSAFVGKEAQLDFYALMAMYQVKNMDFSYGLAKAVIVRNLNNNQVWNLFCPIMSRFYQDLRHNRFCLRLFVKHPDILALAYFNGHNALMSGSYKHALAEYVNIYKQNPKDPFAAFCVSLGLLHLACQKFIGNRHSVVIQLCAFLDIYLELRGECQESLYNVGRAFHQLGLVHNSVHFYKKALECPISVEATDETRGFFDIRREIAYNLALLYQNSGSNDLALYYLTNYVVV